MNKEATMEVVEEVVDAVEPTVSSFGRFLRSHTTHIVGVGVVGVGLGFVGGVLSSREALRRKFETLANEEIAAARDYYRRVHKADEYSDPESALEALHPEEKNAPVDPRLERAARAHRDYTGVPNRSEAPSAGDSDLIEVDPRPDVGSPEVADSDIVVDPTDGAMFSAEQVRERRKQSLKNVFRDPPPAPVLEFDYEKEVPLRSSEAPYVITFEEFYRGEGDYEQTQVTYFEGDDTLVDAKENPIPDPDSIVGEDNLTLFGYGSKDGNIVFVRNEAIQVDFEIARSRGTFAEEVLGTEAELRHEDRRPKKMRDRYV